MSYFATKQYVVCFWPEYKTFVERPFAGCAGTCRVSSLMDCVTKWGPPKFTNVEIHVQRGDGSRVTVQILGNRPTETQMAGWKFRWWFWSSLGH